MLVDSFDWRGLNDLRFRFSLKKPAVMRLTGANGRSSGLADKLSPYVLRTGSRRSRSSLTLMFVSVTDALASGKLTIVWAPCLLHVVCLPGGERVGCHVEVEEVWTPSLSRCRLPVSSKSMISVPRPSVRLEHEDVVAAPAAGRMSLPPSPARTSLAARTGDRVGKFVPITPSMSRYLSIPQAGSPCHRGGVFGVSSWGQGDLDPLVPSEKSSRSLPPSAADGVVALAATDDVVACRRPSGCFCCFVPTSQPLPPVALAGVAPKALKAPVPALPATSAYVAFVHAD